MSRQPRTNHSDKNLLIQGIQYIHKVISGEMSVKEYLAKKLDARDRTILRSPELVWIRKNIDLYWGFLLRCNNVERRIVITRPEIIGFTFTELRDFYAIHNSTMGTFLGKEPESKSKSKKAKPKRRDMLKGSKDLNIRLVAWIALLSRLTEDMLVNDNPIINWNSDYFDFFNNDFRWSQKRFSEYLEVLITKSLNYHDVKPVILETENGLIMHIRIEVHYGTVLVELMNKNCHLVECIELKKILGNKVKGIGVIQTIVPMQRNYTIVLGDYIIENLPPEFVPDVLI